MSARSFNINLDRKQSNIQVIRGEYQGSVGIHVKLHDTVVFFINDNKIKLNSGGWQTVTTKTAINRAFDQLGINGGVFQVKGEWFVEFNGQKYYFADNMVLSLSPLELALGV